MKDYKRQQEYAEKTSYNCEDNRRQNYPQVIINVYCSHTRTHDENNNLKEGTEDHQDERKIVSLTDAVIHPYTMMVKSTHASVTRSTMLTILFTKSFAILAVRELIEVPLIGLILLESPFIFIDSSISGINAASTQVEGNEKNGEEGI